MVAQCGSTLAYSDDSREAFLKAMRTFFHDVRSQTTRIPSFNEAPWLFVEASRRRE